MLLMTIDVVNNNIAPSRAGQRQRPANTKGNPGMAVSSRKPRRSARETAPVPPPRAGAPSNGKARNGAAGIDLGVLPQHLGYLIRRFQVWVFQDFIRTLSSIDIRPAQYSVLVAIGANPGLSQSDLADTLGIERARLVRLLDRLEKRGLTRRLPSPRDRRSHALQLTAEGHKILKKAKALAAVHEARLSEKLGAEPRQAMLGFLREFAR
jgi:DNA-binding MarR family transcriptional regulator